MYNKKTLLQAMSELNKAKAPKKPKDIKVDPMGYWNPDNHGKPVRIPSNNITMEGVNKPLLGIANTGEKKIMQPNKNYNFRGAQYVDEYPVQAKKGGVKKKRKTRSLSGTNILMQKNALFQDHSNKIYDPTVNYFQPGGNNKTKTTGLNTTKRTTSKKSSQAFQTLNALNKAVKPQFVTGPEITLEDRVNYNLGHPMDKAYRIAERVGGKDNDPIDNFRHPMAGRYTAEALYRLRKKDSPWAPDWLNKSAAWVDANMLGVAHEASNFFHPREHRPITSRLRESAEDIYNNAVGINTGLSNSTPKEKTKYLLNKSFNNELPDGIDHPGGQNMYLKKGPKDRGSYKQKGGVSKTHKSKDGTITNLVQKPDGTKLMQVKTKDGKYFEKELSDWEYDKNLLGKSKDISINPQKWGLNDYSDYSSYNSAFRNARESNEDEFTYKGERYNTKLIPKKDSDLYWEGKEFVKDYYKNQPYTKKIDHNLNEYDIENNYIKNKYKTSWSDLYDKKINLENKLGFSKALNNPEWIKLDNLMSQINKEESDILKNKNDEYTNYLNKIKETESINQRNQRISDLDKPAYFSITSQKPKDMREDGYWDKGKNKIFLRTNTQPGKLNTTYVHELSHKGDNIIDVLNTVPKINLKKLNNSPYSSGMNQETYNYVSNPSEIEARKISTLYFLKKHKIPWKSGQINENTINKLYEYYGDNKLPYDIEQLLQLYGGQQEDLLKYLNGNFTYETKYNLEQGGSIELDLTQKEIDEYRKGGYIVEDISVPELNQAQKGIIQISDPKEYAYRKKMYEDSLDLYNYGNKQIADKKKRLGSDRIDLYRVYDKKQTAQIFKKNLETYGNLKNDPGDKYGKLITKLHKKSKILPIGITANVEDFDFLFKKPTEPVALKEEVAVAKKEEPVFETKTSGHTYEDSLRTYNNYLKRREAFDNVKPDTFKSVKELNDYTKKMFKTYPTDYNLALKTESPKKKVTFSNGQSTNIFIDEYKKPTGSKQAKVTKPEQSKYPKGYQPYRLYGRILDPEVYGYGESTNGIPLDVAQFADTYGLKKKMEEYKKSEKYPWVKQEGGNIKTYRSKDGTITNTITKANGDTIVQVKTKDGKYYEKILKKSEALDALSKLQGAVRPEFQALATADATMKKDEEQARQKFLKKAWSNYESWPTSDKVSDRVGAFLNDPFGMTARVITGDQAYIPGMGQGLHNHEDPEVRNRYLKELGYTPGEFDASDLQNMINPGYWATSLTENSRKGNLGTAALEAGLMFLPHLPQGTISRSNMKDGFNLLKNDLKQLERNPQSWFQTPEERLNNPELYKGLGSTTWKDPLSKLYELNDLRKLKKAQARESKLLNPVRGNAEKVAAVREQLGDKAFDKVVKAVGKNKRERALRRSNLPIKPIRFSDGTILGGGEGNLYVNQLNPEEAIKIGVKNGTIQDMDQLVRIGKEMGEAGIEGLENVALPKKVLSLGDDPIRNVTGVVEFQPWLGNKLNPNNPIVTPFSGFKGQGSLESKQKLINIVNELDKKGVGIDYPHNNIIYDQATDSYKLVDFNHVGESQGFHWNKRNMPVEQRLKSEGYLNDADIDALNNMKAGAGNELGSWDSITSDVTKPEVNKELLDYYSKLPNVKLRQKPFSAMNEAEQIEARANFYNNVSPEIKKQLELKLERLSTEKGFNLLKNQEREYLESINVKPEYLDELSEKAAKSRIEELNDILTNNRWGIESADNAYFHSKQSFENEITPEFINAYTSGSADEQVINDIGNLSLDELTPELYTKFKVAKAPKKKYHSIYPQKGQSMTFGVNNMDPRTIVHELTHLQGANRVLPVETRLRDIAQPYSLNPFKKDLSLDPNLERQYNYFRKTFSSKNRNTTEPLSFGNELKQVLLEHKIIKNWDEPITEKTLLEAKKVFKENPVGVYDPQTNQFYSDTRLLDFTHPTRFKMLAEELNKIAPVVKPVTVGAGSLYLGDKLLNKKSSLQQQKKGGIITDLTQAEIQHYVNGGYIVEEEDDEYQDGGSSNWSQTKEAQLQERLKFLKNKNKPEEQITPTVQPIVKKEVVVEQPVNKPLVTIAVKNKQIIAPKTVVKNKPIVKTFEKSKGVTEQKLNQKAVIEKVNQIRTDLKQSFAPKGSAKFYEQFVEKPISKNIPVVKSLHKDTKTYADELQRMARAIDEGDMQALLSGAEPKPKPLFENSNLEKEITTRQQYDNIHYGKFDKRGDDVMNRTDVKRNRDSEIFLADMAKNNSVIIDIGSALGNNDPAMAGVSVWELASNPSIKKKGIKVIATDLPDQVKDFKKHVKNKKAYPIDYAQVPETFNTPVADILKSKKLDDKKDIYLRTANSIDLLMNVDQAIEHLNHISKSLKNKNVTYLYNNVILFKPAGKTTFKKMGNLNNAGFDHNNRSWLKDKNRVPYTLNF